MPPASSRPARHPVARRRSDPPFVGHDTRRGPPTRGWRADAVDLRGHGESEWAADGDYTLDVLSGDVLAIRAPSTRRPRSSGASLGGIASLAAIGEHPDEAVARALVLVDVAPRTEEKGRDRIGAFMAEQMNDGFGSLDEVADAIQRYNPHRPRPSNLGGLEKNLRKRDDGRWYWHWDPAFIGGSSAARTRRGRRSSTRSGCRPRPVRSPFRPCWCAVGSATC